MPNKLNIEVLQTVAMDRGGRLVSTEYINTTTHYLWECSEGHQWKARYDDIRGTKNRKGTWCPVCSQIDPKSRNCKYTISFMQQLAKSRGGKCLSKQLKKYLPPNQN